MATLSNNVLELSARAAMTGTLAAGAINTLEGLGDQSNLTVGLSAIAMAGAVYVADRYVLKPLSRLIGSIPTGSKVHKVGVGLSGLALLVSSYFVSDDVKRVIDDVSGQNSVFEDSEQIKGRTPLERLRSWGHRMINPLPDMGGVQLADKYSTIGRLQRVLRYTPLTELVEDNYNLTRGTLGAMAMQESCGNPLLPNSGADGGLGLLHFQPLTAKQMGLKVYGDVGSDYHDPNNGRQIQNLLEACQNKLECVAQQDERAHLLKNLDAAARIITNAKTEDEGIQRYRGGNKGTRRKYLAKIKEWRGALADNKLLDQARNDFNRRNVGLRVDGNALIFDRYIDAFHKTAPNWGSQIYSSQ